jgi:hypothetical protein
LHEVSLFAFSPSGGVASRHVGVTANTGITTYEILGVTPPCTSGNLLFSFQFMHLRNKLGAFRQKFATF